MDVDFGFARTRDTVEQRRLLARRILGAQLFERFSLVGRQFRQPEAGAAAFGRAQMFRFADESLAGQRVQHGRVGP